MPITLNDLPLNPADPGVSNYAFGVEAYIEGLVAFLEDTTTPMTIALQGEWGSGKTSLMYKLREDLCNERRGQYESVWINTWEYSLMKDSKEALLGIITRMVKATQHGSAGEAISQGFRKFLAGALKTSLGVISNDTSALDPVEKWLTNSAESTVSILQAELKHNIERKFQKSDKKGIIFFIDDLDRLNPSLAVEILELLKNLFTLDKCIFVLAIDYDVVIKGLKTKFGELTDQNEREFRSFFDKIIQVPFSMPVSNYQPKHFIAQSLVEIGYISDQDTSDKSFMDSLQSITKKTVGNNPRSIKRLMNVLSLVKCIYNAQNKDRVSDFDMKHKEGQILNYAILAIQIQYPKIYRMLSQHPGFADWDEEMVRKMNGIRISDEELELISQHKESDEPWEQALYQVCQTDPYLKAKFSDISDLLNIVRERIEIKIDAINKRDDSGKATLSSVMDELVKMSSVTSFSAGDDLHIEVDDAEWKSIIRQYHQSMIDKIIDVMPGYSIRPKRVTKNGGFTVQSPIFLELPFYRKFVDGEGIKLEYDFANYIRYDFPKRTAQDYELRMQKLMECKQAVSDMKEEMDSRFKEMVSDNDWIEWEGIAQYEQSLQNQGYGVYAAIPSLTLTFKSLEDILSSEKMDITVSALCDIINFVQSVDGMTEISS